MISSVDAWNWPPWALNGGKLDATSNGLELHRPGSIGVKRDVPFEVFAVLAGDGVPFRVILLLLRVFRFVGVGGEEGVRVLRVIELAVGGGVEGVTEVRLAGVFYLAFESCAGQLGAFGFGLVGVGVEGAFVWAGWLHEFLGLFGRHLFVFVGWDCSSGRLGTRRGGSWGGWRGGGSDVDCAYPVSQFSKGKKGANLRSFRLSN